MSGILRSTPDGIVCKEAHRRLAALSAVQSRYLGKATSAYGLRSRRRHPGEH